MKKWECVLVEHHENVGSVIEKGIQEGWELHTYTTAQLRGSKINHYLLFVRDI